MTLPDFGRLFIASLSIDSRFSHPGWSEILTKHLAARLFSSVYLQENFIFSLYRNFVVQTPGFSSWFLQDRLWQSFEAFWFEILYLFARRSFCVSVQICRRPQKTRKSLVRATWRSLPTIFEAVIKQQSRHSALRGHIQSFSGAFPVIRIENLFDIDYSRSLLNYYYSILRLVFFA